MGLGPFPKCRRCGDGELVPLSDFSNQGASLVYKAWVCTNAACGYNVKIRSGEIVANEPVNVPPGAQGSHGSQGRSGLREVHGPPGARRGSR